MANPSFDDQPGVHVPRDDAPRERSVGEHIFIWLAWALAAVFWGVSVNIIFGIVRDASQPVSAPSAPGAPGGMGYLGLVIAAFVIFMLALAYGFARTARADGRAGREAGSAALYERNERRGETVVSRHAPDQAEEQSDFR